MAVAAVSVTTAPGAIAQLGERLHGMQEVVGSSPTSSTSEGPANQPLLARVGYFSAIWPTVLWN
jgi:hypothetical protein